MKYLSAKDFENPNDGELYDVVSDWISINQDFFSFENLTSEEQAYLRSVGAQGIVGNGGFAYLFEYDFEEDPSDNPFVSLHWSLKKIGAENAANIFSKVLEFFPDGQPHGDCDERIDFWEEVCARNPELVEDLESRFWDCSEEIDRSATNFFRKHGARLLREQAERWTMGNRFIFFVQGLKKAIGGWYWDTFKRKRVNREIFEQVRKRALENVEKSDRESASNKKNATD